MNTYRLAQSMYDPSAIAAAGSYEPHYYRNSEGWPSPAASPFAYRQWPANGSWQPVPWWDRPAALPPVDPSQFQRSAAVTQRLLGEAGKLVGHVASSPPFAKQLMTAAQNGNHAEVDRLIKTTGVKTAIHTGYTPDGIHFDIPSYEEGNCCKLELTIRWGKSYPG
ncbi:hypothetical protein [Paenibacillus sp. MBLB4367]|uniref:hypothetical protein n=1 Tax=Paenibacillus sp. MBLB4367 TaxID=3384767 RepID=UPI0039080AC3